MFDLLKALIATVTTDHGHRSSYKPERHYRPFVYSSRRLYQLHGSSYRLDADQVLLRVQVNAAPSTM